MEITNSGLKFEGNWHEIVLFAHVLAHFLKDTAPHRESVEEYEEWMPEEDEDEEDMIEKTADEACLDHYQVEDDFNGVHDELRDAEHKLKDSINDIAHGESPTKDLSEAAKDIEILVAAESIISLRKLERSIYKHIMLKFNPYYFDTEDFSVNLKKTREDRYALSINISDDELRKKVQERFSS